jgi:hypothetical protein
MTTTPDIKNTIKVLHTEADKQYRLAMDQSKDQKTRDHAHDIAQKLAAAAAALEGK